MSLVAGVMYPVIAANKGIAQKLKQVVGWSKIWSYLSILVNFFLLKTHVY